MPHSVKLVDSIATSPTVRLNLNDGVTWTCKEFEAPPPRLRRSVSANAMRDGINVSSSNYDARSIRARFRVKKATAEAAATEVQTMGRELDRSSNFLMLQLNALTKPVFFVTYRSDFTDLQPVEGDPTAFEFGVDILAEPFALGLRETLGPFTVNNDPAHASNGCFVDLTGVIGDVETPLVMMNTSRSVGLGVLAVRQHGTPSDMQWWIQAESATLAIDTTNPGGGPDAAMSGTGANNFVRTSFATFATMVGRVQWTVTGWTDAQSRAMRGTFRVFAVVRRSGSSSDINVQLGRQTVGQNNAKVALPKNTGRQLVDMGLLTLGSTGVQTGYGLENAAVSDGIMFKAERTSGTETLDWDAFFLIPADEALMMWEYGNVSTSVDFVVDGYRDDIWAMAAAADPFDGTANPEDSYPFDVSGGFPSLVPNQTNRVFFLETGVSAAMTKGNSSALTFYYWPRYLAVRPAAT